MPKKEKPPWKSEDWFKPLTDLEGYKVRNHSESQKVIEQTCERAEVEPAKVIESFAKYYPQGRVAHNWKDPVLSLVRTLEIQISKAKSDVPKTVIPNNGMKLVGPNQWEYVNDRQ